MGGKELDFAFTEEQEQFRGEVREFLQEELEKGTFATKSNHFIEVSSPEFSRKLAQKGWMGLTWPKEYGGANRSYVDRTILMEELMTYQAPLMYHFSPQYDRFSNIPFPYEEFPLRRDNRRMTSIFLRSSTSSLRGVSMMPGR